MTRVETQVEIDAPAERIWAILIDFPAYGEWNPFITEVIGRPQLGARLTIRFETPGHRPVTRRPVVTEVEPDHELAWASRLGVPGLFDGEHRLRLDRRSDGGSSFVQSQRLRGVLVPLLRGLDKTVEAGFKEMNEALKARAEAVTTN